MQSLMQDSKQSFTISQLQAGGGTLGICPIPGSSGAYSKDLAVLLEWEPDMVLSVTETAELARIESWSLGQQLLQTGIHWQHLPVADMSTPKPQIIQLWPQVSKDAQQLLSVGGKVLVHCVGGCGRSGMMLMRLMVDIGEAPDLALVRLRAVRACAVETEAQRLWAAQG